MRKEVRAFASQMEDRLQEFDEERGGNSWQQAGTNPLMLIDMARNNLEQLADAIERRQGGQTVFGMEIRDAASDVANLVMMAVDVSGALIPDQQVD